MEPTEDTVMESQPRARDYLTAKIYGMAVITVIFAYCDVPSLAELAQVSYRLNEKVIENGRVGILKGLFEKGNMNLFMKAAIEAGEVRLVYLAVRCGATAEHLLVYNPPRGQCNSGLECAATAGNMELVEFFISRGTPLGYGLWGACASGDMALVDWFLQHDQWVSPYDREHHIGRGLARACFGGHQVVVEALFELGATHAYDAMYNAVLGRHSELVKWLCDKEVYDKRGRRRQLSKWPPGFRAAVHIGSKEWVDYFIKRTMDDGDEVNYADALVWANQAEQPEMAAYLTMLSSSRRPLH